MSVELALGSFPARWLPASPTIARACELHARGFNDAAALSFVSRPLETLS